MTTENIPEFKEENNEEKIIAVDLDGTLMRGDSFLDACLTAMRIDFSAWWRRSQREDIAKLKWWMYRFLMTDASKNERAAHIKGFSWNEGLLEWLKAKREKGARIFLASASPDYFLEEVNRELGGIFEGVIGSTETINRSAAAKALALQEKFAGQKFSYVGNSEADIAVWKVSARAYNVNPSRGLIRSAKAQGVELVMLSSNPQHWIFEVWDIYKRNYKRNKKQK
jgi:phosphoserine phosphatase